MSIKQNSFIGWLNVEGYKKTRENGCMIPYNSIRKTQRKKKQNKNKTKKRQKETKGDK
jgi:hypothetical protein